MAIVSATKYENMNSVDRFGAPLLANDGNGDIYGENTKIWTIHRLNRNERRALLRAEKFQDFETSEKQLDDIMEMRAQMAMNPMKGDVHLGALLDLDEQLILTGKIDRKLITETYPDIEKYLFELLVEDDQTAVAVGELFEGKSAISTPDFPGSPEEVLFMLEDLAANEADQVLQVLIDQGMAHQIEAIRESTHEDSESPLIPA